MLSRFKSYIVFYSPITDGIKIWHVFHGARNYDAILADEFGPDNDDEALDP